MTNVYIGVIVINLNLKKFKFSVRYFIYLQNTKLFSVFLFYYDRITL